MTLLEELRGGLIVSVQAWAGSALDDPVVIAAMARAAQDNGAVAVRVQGAAQIRAVRARVEIPLIGLIKRRYDGFEPYITPTPDEVREAAAAGADAVALDATPRARPAGASLADLLQAVDAEGLVAVADCATAQEAELAASLGAPVVATTLCGYTAETAGRPLPALDLVRALGGRGSFVVCEGGIRRPASVRAAFRAGADAVVVGTAITNVDWLVGAFAGAARRVR